MRQVFRISVFQVFAAPCCPRPSHLTTRRCPCASYLRGIIDRDDSSGLALTPRFSNLGHPANLDEDDHYYFPKGMPMRSRKKSPSERFVNAIVSFVAGTHLYQKPRPTTFSLMLELQKSRRLARELQKSIGTQR